MDELLDISETSDNGVPVLALRGEIDLSSSPQLREALVRLQEEEPPVVVLDLSDVTFLDSTGLGILIGALKRRESAGGDLRLVITRPNLLKVFEITGLTTVFRLFPSRAEACT
ncbi:MAG TPA: STAS domain-containing protein [Acidimicrobiales bacterium]|nr:STAS domain-containing protein [Acidimicrobiales bacterium]